MIKLTRGKRPKELTDEILMELTELYRNNNHKDVWNSPKIKKPLKEALLKMSYGKCVYCECLLEEESKDATIDHFLPKTAYENKVVEWENLFPSCLRCNRQKNSYDKKLLNPCKANPQYFLGVCRNNRFRLKGIDRQGLGKDTIREIGLNDIKRVLIPRAREWEIIRSQLEEICESLQDDGYQPKQQRKFKHLMEDCMAENSYAAVKATNMLNDECYQYIKNFLMSKNEWTSVLDEIESELKKIALQLVSFFEADSDAPSHHREASS